MNVGFDVERVVAAHEAVRAELLGERTVGGHWVGELGPSPLATATAISALVTAHASGSISVSVGSARDERPDMQQLVNGDLSELLVDSLRWLAERQNEDGGWSDTEHGRSSIAATMLVQAAFRLTGVPAKYQDLTERADEYIEAQGGAAALKKKYGKDKTLSAPILANLALAGLIPWRQVPALPFELVCMPQNWHARLRLPVASYAIPALVAVGQLKYRHDPPRNPATRLLRMATRKASLALLERMQPESGGYLEATPLTAFVVMSLAGCGLADHPIVVRGIEFLLAQVRSDASWSISANLATWNTTLAMDALARRVSPSQIKANTPADSSPLNAAWYDTARADDTVVEQDKSSITTAVMRQNEHESDSHDEHCLDWLLECQRVEGNPVTGEVSGGWAWTDLAGGIPNTDDTAAALIAIASWRSRYPHLKSHRLQLVARRGVEWLLNIQNDDGGWPTFRRGWNALPADRSASDVTAHAIRALAIWQNIWKGEPSSTGRSTPPVATPFARISTSMLRGVAYLEQEQRNDGSFVPLWFGNQHHPEGHNLVYGTARVLMMCAELGRLDSDMAERAARWLIGVQHANGGWGPPRSSPATSLSNIYRSNSSRAEDALASFCSVEETSLALEALLPLADSNQLYARAVQNGLVWLVEAVEQGRLRQPATIGFYFAKLWYHERLYPLVFATSALGSTVGRLAPQRSVAAHVG